MVVDPETMPYLDIANQTGRSLRIPPAERKVSQVWEACPGDRLSGGAGVGGLCLFLRMKSSDSLGI
jgi:hypothetical protein